MQMLSLIERWAEDEKGFAILDEPKKILEDRDIAILTKEDKDETTNQN